MQKYRLGLLAEYFIYCLYKVCFYNILHHRMKTYVGEIDLIAKRGKQIVFIEVKARKNGICENIISAKQQYRIIQAAKLFLARNPQYANYNIRFDLAVVIPYRLPLIIKNAWY